ncbi:MAG: universal stress protein [Caulobacteraceae bacterium]
MTVLAKARRNRIVADLRAPSEEGRMSYAAILVHVEAQPIGKARLELAADLANDFEAALVGVGAEIFEPPSSASMGYVDGEVIKAEADTIEADLKRAEAAFRNAAKRVRAGSEWAFAVAMPAEAAILRATTADLIVAGPKTRLSWGFHTCADPGDLLMGAGRPILVTPAGLERLDASRTIVAWKNTREARRALADALPFLKRAEEVAVVEVCERRDDAAAAERLAEVVSYLGRHGVRAATESRPRGKAQTADVLVEIAEERKAGLIVAGGYGHARLREWAFGGVTSDLLSGYGVAVLLSH